MEVSPKVLAVLTLLTACLVVVTIGLSAAAYHYASGAYLNSRPVDGATTTITTIATIAGTTSSATPPVTRPEPTPAPHQQNVRLPTSLQPEIYHLWLKPYLPWRSVHIEPSKEFTFDGRVQIGLKCLLTTHNVTLNMHDIVVDSSSVLLTDDASGTVIEQSKKYSQNDQLQQVTFYFQKPLESGKTYKLSMNYIGQLSTDLYGFYRSSYEENGQIKWLAATHFEPTEARRALPCFDEPIYKAKFNVKIVHPKTMTALCNNIETGVRDLENGWSETSFLTTPKMSSYLLAFVVCEFDHREKISAKGVKFRVWARPSVMNQTKLALYSGPLILDYYAEYFAVPFPLEKQDMIALPDFSSGAMENWGLITYRETALLYSPESGSIKNQLRVVDVVAHELAHQWFGDLVTMDWWSDLWLNEGFASYVEYIGVDQVNETFHMNERFYIDDMMGALELDQLPNSHSVFTPVHTPAQINSIFDSISYNKGAALIRMLNYTVTERFFRDGLNRYLTKYEYSNANHDDLWHCITEAVAHENTIKDWNGHSLNVSSLMNPWISQTGYPMVQVSRNYATNTATLSQERFVMTSGSMTGIEWYEWHIPVWYLQKNQTNFTWMKPGSATTFAGLDKSAWLLVNHNVPGYFRVNYDVTNWELLRRQLEADYTVFVEPDRAMLLDDALNFAKANKLAYETALDLTTYLKKETAYIPWSAVSVSLAYIESMFATTADYQYFRAYYLSLIGPAFLKVNLNQDSDTEKPLQRLMDVFVVNRACQLESQPCITEACALFKTFVQRCRNSANGSSPCTNIKPDLRKTVYCTGLKFSDIPSWLLLWKLYQSEQVSTEKDNLLRGLTCTREPVLIIKLMNQLLKPDVIRIQDLRTTFLYLSTNDVARQMLWNYFEERADAIIARYNSTRQVITGVIIAATAGFNTKYQLKLMETVLEKHSTDLGPANATFYQQLDKTKTNVQWMKNNYPTVLNWLKQHQQ